MLRRPNPLLIALSIGFLAQALFLWHLATPHILVFDEVHYVPAARTLLELSGPINTEHPLLAKELIAAGIALFGDNSFGWRFFSTVAGSATIVSVFGILWLLFGRLRPAVMGAIFVLLNFTVFIQARIAMLDGFYAAFTLGAIAAMLWAMRAPVDKTWQRWIVASMLFGLGVACKWTAIPYGAYAVFAFLVVRWRDARIQKRPAAAAFSGKHQPHWPGLSAFAALGTLGLVSISIYFLTFLPAFFYTDQPLTLSALLPFQAAMWAQQTQVLPHHNYQSSWWSWPLLIRPIWYLYQAADGAQRGILMLGNPVLMWGGLVAVLACLWKGVRERDPKLLAVAGLWIASVIVWAVTPKSIGFYYYYYLSSIFLCMALAAAFERWARGKWAHWDEGFAILAFGVAVYFLPILSAAALPNDMAFLHWMWFSTWI